MISAPLDFLEEQVRSLGIAHVLRDAAQALPPRPYCRLVPMKGTLVRDGTRVAKDLSLPDRVTHILRRWRVENPVRVAFFAEEDAELWGVRFIDVLPNGFEWQGRWVEVDVTAEFPLPDGEDATEGKVLRDKRAIAYDVVFRSGIYGTAELPMFKDASLSSV